MGFRKVIGFGDSSYVVSLPKEWVVKNGIKKGDVMSVSDDDEVTLKLTPQNVVPKKTPSDIKIEFKNIKYLKSQLVYTYVSNYDTITITGSELSKYIIDIRNEVKNFVALELIQYGDKSVILKDYLDIRNISVYDTIRRIDRIIISMAEGVGNMMQTYKLDNYEEIKSKEGDINKLSNLIFKILKRSFNPVDRNILKLTLDDIFYYWELTLFLEKFADQIKRIPKYCKDLKPNEDLLRIYNNILDQYNLAMKANYTKSVDLAADVMAKKGATFKECDVLTASLTKDYSYVLEKIRNMNSHTGNISKVLLKLHRPINES